VVEENKAKEKAKVAAQKEVLSAKAGSLVPYVPADEWKGVKVRTYPAGGWGGGGGGCIRGGVTRGAGPWRAASSCMLADPRPAPGCVLMCCTMMS
jgi:hypothetical protein